MRQLPAIALIAIVAAAISAALILLKPEAEKKPVVQPVTKVTAVEVRPEAVPLKVRSQGTIMPVTETDLSVQVNGRIEKVSGNFREGSFVRKGEPLIHIEKEDYEAVLALREAELAGALLSLATEEALAKQASRDWEAMGSGKASELTLRNPQLAQARALVKSARASVEKAKRDLQRTVVRAPYDAFILTRHVDLGQYVTAAPATKIARIFNTAMAEVRLPVSVEDATHLQVESGEGATVILYRDTPQGRCEWTARLARIEATIDTSSRLLHAIAEIDNPFRLPEEPGKIPLKRGLFVEAEIEGRILKDVYSLPRYALRGSESLYIVTPESTLVQRSVKVLHSDTRHVVVGAGLAPGEKVATSPVAYFSENMPVQLIEAQ